MSLARERILITCEHGGNRIPLRFRPLFAVYRDLLTTHRGWDMGALVLAREMAADLGAPLIASTTSRLLIDLNRSIGHPHLYSEPVRLLPSAEKSEIVRRYYRPHRERVEHEVESAVSAGRRIVHIASHSCTPELDGEVRNADIGILYDPKRSGEVELAKRWTHAIEALRPDLRVRRNYPYRGSDDGLTSFLRRRHPESDYCGLELEVNQKNVLHGGLSWQHLRTAVILALRNALGFPA